MACYAWYAVCGWSVHKLWVSFEMYETYTHTLIEYQTPNHIMKLNGTYPIRSLILFPEAIVSNSGRILWFVTYLKLKEMELLELKQTKFDWKNQYNIIKNIVAMNIEISTSTAWRREEKKWNIVGYLYESRQTQPPDQF